MQANKPFWTKRQFTALIESRFRNKSVAARELGVTRQALYDWLDHGPTFNACATLYTYLGRRGERQVLGTVETPVAGKSQ